MKCHFFISNLIKLFFFLVFTINLSAQKEELIYKSTDVSRADRITKFSDDLYMISGTFPIGWKPYVSFIDGKGNLLKTIIIDNYIIFQRALVNGEAILFCSNGDVIKINLADYSTRICDNIYLSYDFPLPVTQNIFLKEDTLFVLLKEQSKSTFEYITFSISQEDIISIQKNVEYPLKGLTGYYSDNSIGVIRADTSLWFEKHDPDGNLKFKVRLDTIMTSTKKIIFNNENGVYILGHARKNYPYSVVCSINSFGLIEWYRNFEPVIVNSNYRHFRLMEDIIESSDHKLILVGTHGYVVTGPKSNAEIIKIDKNGNLILEKQSILHNEGASSYQVVEDSKGNYFATGTLGISDYEIPNRAYVLKYSNLNTYVLDKNDYEPLTVYPNPFSGLFYIESNLDKTLDCFIEIYNSQGKKIFTKGIRNSKEEINLTPSKNQIYFLRLINYSNCYFSKTIISE